jgi:3-dehydrosphinganine reductase
MFATAALGTPAALWLVDALMSRLRQFSFEGCHVLITGGSSGIGLATAKALLVLSNPPSRITIAARTANTLQTAKTSLADSSIHTLTLDVTDHRACSEAAKGIQAVDVLINCAGTSLPGTLETLSIDDIDTTVKLNLLGSIYLTKALLPSMKQRGKGRIVFVSSQAGQAGLYGYTAYSASKFGLRGFAEALAMEVAPAGLAVSIAFPPDTPCLARENLRKPAITRLISEASGSMTADAVASKLIAGVAAGHFLISMNLDGWILSTLALGMPPASASLVESALQLLLLPILRIVGLAYHAYFTFIVSRNYKLGP